jgi:pyruvate formate lyase activating enzyme
MRSTARSRPTNAGSRRWQSRRDISTRRRVRNFTHIWTRRTSISRRLPGEFYHKPCFGELEPVLDSLHWLTSETSVWFDAATLPIPEEEITRLSDWFLSNLGPNMPMHSTPFHPDFKMLDVPGTPPETVVRARKQALSAGLKHVDDGDIHDLEMTRVLRVVWSGAHQARLVLYEFGRYNL